jgi:hypothetical protein
VGWGRIVGSGVWLALAAGRLGTADADGSGDGDGVEVAPGAMGSGSRVQLVTKRARSATMMRRARIG